MSPRFICILAYRRVAPRRDATIRLRVHYYTFTRATVARNASGCRVIFLSLSLFSFVSCLLSLSIAVTYPRFPHGFILLFYWIGARRGIQNAGARSMARITSRTRTLNGYRRPFLSRSLLFERRCFVRLDGTATITTFERYNESRMGGAGPPLTN